MADYARVSEQAPRRGIGSPYAILGILTLVNFLNYVDRQIVSGLVPHLKQSIADGGLGLTDTQVGLLQSAFMIVHSIASIPLGIAADRFVRKRLIALGVAVWSVATAAAGMTRSFGQLFASRALIGVGEAVYAPAATSLISERFPEAARGRAIGVFQAGMLFGGVVGIAAGATVAPAYGWRAAFFLVGAPGLIAALIALWIVEPRRAAPGQRKSMTQELVKVVGSPGIGWIYAAGILITFMVGALQHWGVEFIIRYHYHGVAAASAKVGMTFAPVAFAGVIGALGGSVLADALERRMPGRGRLLVVAMGPLAGAPFVLLAIWTSSLPLLYVGLAIGTGLNAFYIGPVLATLHDVVGERAHATATGLYFFLVHFLGDAISPTVVGFVSQKTGSLRVATTMAAAAAVIGACCALLGLRGAARAVAHHASAGRASDQVAAGSREARSERAPR